MSEPKFVGSISGVSDNKGSKIFQMVTQEVAEGDSSSRSDEENARDFNEEKTPVSTEDATKRLTSSEEITGISKRHRTKDKSLNP